MVWGEWFWVGARWVFAGHAVALGFSRVDAQDTSRDVFDTKEEFEKQEFEKQLD
jgi:hypothetical protein